MLNTTLTVAWPFLTDASRLGAKFQIRDKAVLLSSSIARKL
jgi:hypothetical protein